MPIETTFIVVRHGESASNMRGTISNKNVDHPLTARGIEQAREAADRLQDEKIDFIVSSSRQRALDTAKIINANHNVKIVQTDDLIERDYGIFSGVDKSKANKVMRDQGFDWLDIPQSETADALDRRVAHVTTFVTKHHAGQRVLISTHEDIVRSFARVLGGKTVKDSMAFTVENAQPFRFVHKGSIFELSMQKPGLE